MKKNHFYLKTILFLFAVMTYSLGWGQTNPTAHNLGTSNYSFTGFSDGATTTYPTSMEGWKFAAEPGSTTVGSANGDRVLAASSTSITTGSIRNEVENGISLLNSGTNNIGAIVVAINTTGRESIKVTWTAQQLNSGGSGGTDRINGLQLQYRVGTSGDFTTVSSTEYLTTNTTSQNDAQTFSNIELPSVCNNESVVQVRWIYYISSGTANSRDRIRLDDILITSSASSSGVDNPTNLLAEAATGTTDQIDLIWDLNGASDDVVLAWSSNGTFGTPSGTYSVGDPISGGGTILYVGSLGYYEHQALTANTTYYYKLWSFDGADYSSGITTNVTTNAIENPSNVLAMENGSDEIEIVWDLNTANNAILFAWSPNGTFGTPSGTYSVSDPISGGGTVLYAGTNTDYTHTSLNDNTTYYYKVWSYNGSSYSSGVTTNATTDAIIYPEPDNHVSNFTATVNSQSQITVTWTDATGTNLPYAYLIKAAIAPASPTAPVDGTEEANAALVKNVLHDGTETAVFTGLDPATTYNFAIWPYANTAANINYKLGSEPTAQAQTLAAPNQLFLESFGNVTANTLIVNHTDWDNTTPVLYSGTADIRSTTPSNYSNASGLANVFFTNTVGRYLLIEGIDVRNFDNISLSLGHYKSSADGNNELAIEVSSDGTNWTQLTYSRATGTGTANWIIIEPSGTIPANVENLRIRFTQTSSTTQFRIDDIKLSGYYLTDATHNTITINGVNSGWNTGEIFPNVSNADNAHFTWDADYLYFGISGAEADYGNMATHMFFNTMPDNPYEGTVSAYAWGEYVNTLFKSNYVLVWRNNTDYSELMSWNGTAWTSVTLNANDVDFAVIDGNDYREVRIKRSILGVDNTGDKIKVASFTEQQWGSNYRYFGWPSEGWVDGNRTANQTFTYAYTYALDQYVYPNEAQYLKKDIFFASNTTIDTDVSYSNVYVEPGVHLEIDAANTLTVNDKLVLMSDATGTASFIDKGTLTFTGTASVHKYLPSTTTSGWYVAAPVNGANYTMFDDADGLFSYNSTVADWQTVTSGNLMPLVGYVTKYPTEKTVAFDGNLNTGAISRTDLVRTGYQSGNYGWNLVGNPYPSPINWEDANITKTNLNHAIYIRKADDNIAYYVSGDSLNGGTRFIGAMQAFWVQVFGDVANPTGTATLGFTNTARTDFNNVLLKSTKSVNDRLELSLEKNGMIDQGIIRFLDGATDAFDPAYDAAKFYVSNPDYPQLFTLTTAQDEIAINSLPLLTANKTVAVGYKTNTASPLSISVDGITTFDTNVSIHLEDLTDNTIIDLRQQNTYTFNAQAGKTTDRILIHFGLTTTVTENNLYEMAVNIYANDNSIYVSNLDTKGTVQIYNMLGQELSNQSLEAHTVNKINVNLSTGQYIVKVTSNKGSKTQKVFIR